MGDREHPAARIALVCLHPGPQVFRIGAVIIGERDEVANLAGVIAEYYNAVEVIGVRR